MATKRSSRKRAAVKTKKTARQRAPAKRKDRESPTEYTYRGKTIRLEPARGTRTPERLVIHGRQVNFMRTEEGVTSHASMYMVFGSPFELAEELVRQWGDSESDLASDPGDRKH